MQRIDLRVIKTRLRDQSKQYSREMSKEDKAERDLKICRRFQSLYQYRQAKTILCYTSKAIEVDTYRILQDALDAGKQVAVPRCIDGTRLMRFYLIRSLEDLEKGTFGVMEPIVAQCQELTDFSGSICIVPALGYDLEGYRLGYGAGYYDRFLSGYSGLKIGIIYAACVKPRLPRGKFDVPVNLLLTEDYLRSIKPSRRRTFYTVNRKTD